MQAFVRNKDILADLYLPKKDKNNKIGIVWLPGLPNQPKEALLGNRISEAGFTMLHPRYPGSWQSYGNFGPASSLEGALLALELLSKRKTIDLASQNEVEWDVNHLILVGHSYGGGIAMCAQGVSQLSDATIVFSPLLEAHLQNEDPLYPEDDLTTLYPYLKRCHENTFRNLDEIEWENFLKGKHPCNPNRYIDVLVKNPILLIHGEEDTVIRPYHTENFYNKLKRNGSDCIDLMMINGAGHDKTLPLDTFDLWSEWIKKRFNIL